MSFHRSRFLLPNAFYVSFLRNLFFVRKSQYLFTSEQNRIAISFVVHFRLGDIAEATDSRFVSLDDTIESFIEEHENPNTVKKTKRDVTLLTVFLQTKGETREMAEIPPVELNIHIKRPHKRRARI